MSAIEVERIALLPVVVDRRCEEHGPALPQVVDRGVVRDAEQPARKSQTRIERAERAEHLDERVLREVFRHAGILHESRDQVVDRPLESRDQRLAGDAGAAERLDCDLGVALQIGVESGRPMAVGLTHRARLVRSLERWREPDHDLQRLRNVVGAPPAFDTQVVVEFPAHSHTC